MEHAEPGKGWLTGSVWIEAIKAEMKKAPDRPDTASEADEVGHWHLQGGDDMNDRDSSVNPRWVPYSARDAREMTATLSFEEIGVHTKLAELVFEGYRIPREPKAACLLMGGRSNPRKYDPILRRLIDAEVVVVDGDFIRIPLAERFLANAMRNLRAKQQPTGESDSSQTGVGLESDYTRGEPILESDWSQTLP